MKLYQQYMYSYPHKTAYRPIDRVVVGDYLQKLTTVSACGLYVHLPFCQNKCGYCNLFSVAGASEQVIDTYLDAIARQIDCFQQKVALRSVPFNQLVLGGGTPIYLHTAQLERLLTLLSSKVGITPQNTMSVIELSPNQTTEDKLDLLKSSGFKRVSIGVQSFIADELKMLARQHQPASCHHALTSIKKRSFDTVNIDLIYGINNQTLTSWQESLAAALYYEPDELFLYPLYIRSQTSLDGHLAVDEQAAYRLYQFAREYLLDRGWQQCSMRRFVKTPSPITAVSCGFEYNLALGCGGRSYLGALHVCEPYQVTAKACWRILHQFLSKTDFLAGLSGFILDNDEQKRRYVIKNLLYHHGINTADYRKLFTHEVTADFPQLTELVAKKMAIETDEQFSLTPLGLSYSDCIGPQFISSKVAALSSDYWRQEKKI